MNTPSSRGSPSIGAQGIAIMINRKVDLFSARNLAVISTILVIGLGGNYGFAGGMIPFFGIEYYLGIDGGAWAGFNALMQQAPDHFHMMLWKPAPG